MHVYQILKASTNISVELRIIDSTDGTPETGVVFNTTGLALEYRRDGAVSTAITEVVLAALTTAHADGGFLHIGNGVYRFDLPDAALATGVDKVVVHGTVTGMVVIGCVIQLVSYDPFDAVRLGLTALPNAAADAAGGLPISDAGALDLDARLDAAITSRLAPTVAARTLDITATGAAGVDWANVENQGTTVDLSATDIQQADTVATLTGHTPQTADHTAGIADVPTVAEFNARTLVAASYFDPAADAVANVTLVATTTTNTDMVAEAATVVQNRQEMDSNSTQLAAIITDLDNGTDGLGALLAAIQVVMTTQMTEAYAADGVAPTPAQSLFLIQQALTEFLISGTVFTISELDGSTTAATLTLNDAANPTGATRAT